MLKSSTYKLATWPVLMVCQIYEYYTSTRSGWHPTLLSFFLSICLSFFHCLLKPIYLSLIHMPHLFLFSPSLKHCNGSIFDDCRFPSSAHFVYYPHISKVHSYGQTQWWSRINCIGEGLFEQAFSKGRERGSRKWVGLAYLIYKIFERHFTTFHAYCKEWGEGVYAVFRAVSSVGKWDTSTSATSRVLWSENGRELTFWFKKEVV